MSDWVSRSAVWAIRLFRAELFPNEYGVSGVARCAQLYPLVGASYQVSAQWVSVAAAGSLLTTGAPLHTRRRVGRRF